MKKFGQFLESSNSKGKIEFSHFYIYNFFILIDIGLTFRFVPLYLFLIFLNSIGLYEVSEFFIFLTSLIFIYF
jgi:hypothetical protein